MDSAVRIRTDYIRDFLIFVIDTDAERAISIRDLIAFMDMPEVEVTDLDRWQSQRGDRHLAAVFISNDLADKDKHHVIDEIGIHDPQIDIVIVNRVDEPD